MKNADLANVQNEDADVDSDGDSVMADEGNYKLKPLSFLKKVQGDASLFLNRFSGSAARLKTCKHYSHFSCLQKYIEQQLTGEEGRFHSKVAGYSRGEFSCPICKSLSSTLVPSISLDKVMPHAAVEIDGSRLSLLNYFADFFSNLILKQQGLVYT